MCDLTHHLDLGTDEAVQELFAEEVSASEQMQACCEGCAFCMSTLMSVTGCFGCYSTASCYSCDCGS